MTMLINKKTVKRVYKVVVHKGHASAHVVYLGAAIVEGHWTLYSYAAGALLIFTVGYYFADGDNSDETDNDMD